MGSFYAETNLVATNLHDDDRDVVVDDNGFVFLSA